MGRRQGHVDLEMLAMLLGRLYRSRWCLALATRNAREAAQECDRALVESRRRIRIAGVRRAPGWPVR